MLIGISYTNAADEPAPVSDLFAYSISYNILQTQPSPEVLGCGRMGSFSNRVEGTLSPRLYCNIRDDRCSSAYVTFAKDSQLYSCHVALDDILYKRFISVHKLLPYAHCKTDSIVNVDITPLQDTDSNERRNLLVYYDDGNYHRFQLAKVMSASSIEVKEIHDDFTNFLQRIMTEKMNREYVLSRVSAEIKSAAPNRNPYDEIRIIASSLVDQEPAGYSWGKEIHTHMVYELPVNLVKQKRDKHKELCKCLIDLYESGEDWSNDSELKLLVNELCMQQHRLSAVYSMSHDIESNYKEAFSYPNECFMEAMKAISVAMDNSVKQGGYLHDVLQNKYQNYEEEVVDQLSVRGITTTDVFYANVTAIDEGLLAISTVFCETYSRNGTHEQRIKYSYQLLMIYCHMLQEASKSNEDLRSNEVTNRDMDYKYSFVCSSSVRRSVLLLLNTFIGRNNADKSFTEQALLLRDIIGLYGKTGLKDLCDMCDVLLSSYEVQCIDSHNSGESASNMPADFRREYEEMKDTCIKMLLLLGHIPEAYDLSIRYYYFFGMVYCAHTIQDSTAVTCAAPGCGNYARYNKVTVGSKPKYCIDCKTDETMGNVTLGYQRLYHVISEHKDELATYETTASKRMQFYTYCLQYFHQPKDVERDVESDLFAPPPCEILLDLLQFVVPDIDDSRIDSLGNQRLKFLKHTPDIAGQYYIRNSDYTQAAEYCYEAGMNTSDDDNKEIMHSMSKLAAKLYDLKCEPAVTPSPTSFACSQLLSCQKVAHVPASCSLILTNSPAVNDATRTNGG